MINVDKRVWAFLGLVGAVALWGVSYVVVQNLVVHYSLWDFFFLRFLIGGGLLWVLVQLHPHSRHHWREMPKLKIALVSVAAAVSYVSMAVGLQQGIPAALAAMIGALVVVLTPLLDWAWSGKTPSWRLVVTTGLVLGGVLLVAKGNGGSIHTSGLGVGLEVVSVLASTVQIVLLERLAQKVNLLSLVTGQLLMLAIIMGGVVVATNSLVIPAGWMWPELIFSGVGASALGFLLQAAAQKHLTNTTTAIVMSLEPGFTLVAGMFMGVAQLSGVAFTGVASLVGAAVWQSDYWMGGKRWWSWWHEISGNKWWAENEGRYWEKWEEDLG